VGYLRGPPRGLWSGAAHATADFNTAAVIVGEVVDLISDIPSAAEIVERMTVTATQLLAGASNKYRITKDR
jgi:nitronate monooxygenase